MTRLILVLTAVFIWAGIAQSTHPIRRSCYPSYTAPVVTTHYQPYLERHYYPEQVEVRRDYYFSIDGSYRDKIFLDALVGRLLTEEFKDARKAIRGEDREIPGKKNPIVEEPTPGVETAVPKIVQAAVNAKCIKCHNPTIPERADLSNLAAVSPAVRWHSHGLVTSGEMPKGGANLSDEEVLGFYEWAKVGSKAYAAAKKAR